MTPVTTRPSTRRPGRAARHFSLRGSESETCAGAIVVFTRLYSVSEAARLPGPGGTGPDRLQRRSLRCFQRCKSDEAAESLRRQNVSAIRPLDGSSRDAAYTELRLDSDAGSVSKRCCCKHNFFSQSKYNLAQRCSEDVSCTLETALGDTPPCSHLAVQALGLPSGWTHWNLGDNGPCPSS